MSVAALREFGYSVALGQPTYLSDDRHQGAETDPVRGILLLWPNGSREAEGSLLCSLALSRQHGRRRRRTRRCESVTINSTDPDYGSWPQSGGDDYRVLR